MKVYCSSKVVHYTQESYAHLLSEKAENGWDFTSMLSSILNIHLPTYCPFLHGRSHNYGMCYMAGTTSPTGPLLKLVIAYAIIALCDLGLLFHAQAEF